MGDYAAKGREYVDKADKKLKGFSLFTSSSSKNEDAVELLERAATQFKLAQSCESVLRSGARHVSGMRTATTRQLQPCRKA